MDIVKIENEKLFMTIPTVQENYKRKNRSVENVDYSSYKQTLYDFRVEKIQMGNHIENCFIDNPREYIKELYKKQTQKIRDIKYIITTYHSYPLLEESSTAIYNKKLVENRGALAFSICDNDSLAPILALDWLRRTKSNGIIICLEHVYKEAGLGKYPLEFPIQDAAALFQISNSKLDYEIKGYVLKNRRFDRPFHEESSLHSYQYIINFLSYFNLLPHEVIAIPQCKNHNFLKQIKSLFPCIYHKKRSTNLFTADVYYSLSELGDFEESIKHILLMKISNTGNIGLILLKRTR
ncbi:hypothetical protein [Bacillus sp. 166amftsu]|uniref:hypothetical protein n=1 Tax=Bacillus sp. 166amftsu TaxID=1761753 RepID=UPI00089A12A9|nr:hypothetical protein [Bacillus sp. 166amftsu]SDZ37895.1 hypothetical protein SAMN04488156_12247 [Bacillus sp. 166amftsu]